MARENRNSLLNKKAALKGEKAPSKEAPLQGLMRKRAKLSGEPTNDPARPLGRFEQNRNKLLGVAPEGVRSEQVSTQTGGTKGQSTVGITGPTGAGRGTRGGLSIN